MPGAYRNGRFIIFARMGLCFPTRTFRTFATNVIADNATSYWNCIFVGVQVHLSKLGNRIDLLINPAKSVHGRA